MMNSIFSEASSKKLISLTLNTDGYVYYLTAVFEVEVPDGIYEVTIPKINIPIDVGQVDIDIFETPDLYSDPSVYSELKAIFCTGYNKFQLDKQNGIFYQAKLIKEKTHDITLKEIQDKLGYKIRIVEEK